MTEEFDSLDAARRLRGTAGRMAEILRLPIASGAAPEIASAVVSEIAGQLGLRIGPRLTDDRSPPLREHGTIAINPAVLLQSIARTLAFAREYLEGVPTIAPGPPDILYEDAPTYTVIAVFNRVAMQRVVFARRQEIVGLPDPMGDGERAELLRRVLPDHPWARLTREADILQGLGMGLTLSFARNVHAAATNQPTTVNYTVTTQNHGLVLDAFPELNYSPQRFGSTSSSPVNGGLSTGWWKFEAVHNGSLVRDKGRHQATSTNTSTVTRDF